MNCLKEKDINSNKSQTFKNNISHLKVVANNIN